MSHDREQLIRIALSPEPSLAPPPDLAEQISRAVRETPQRRPVVPNLSLRRPELAPVLRLVVLMLLLLALLGLSLVFLTQPPRLAEVPMYHGGPERTGVLPGPGPVGEPAVAWRTVLPDPPVPSTTMPVVADGRVFLAGGNGTIWALAESDGTELWRVALGGPIRASPLIAAGQLVVASETGEVVALRAADGSEAWRFSATAPVTASLVTVDGVVYVASEDGRIHALEATTGRHRWSQDTGGLLNRGPAISEGVLYVANHEGVLSALELATGDPGWSVALGGGGVSTPIVAGGRAYVGRDLDGLPSLVALGSANGERHWEFRSPLGLQVRPGALDDERVYVVSEDNNVYALDRSSGELQWTHETTARIGSLASLADGVLYVVSRDGSLRALEAATGSLVWMLELEGEPTMPAVIGGRVVVATGAGNVVAIAGEDSVD